MSPDTAKDAPVGSNDLGVMCENTIRHPTLN
jgi:hypothetical protein